MEVSLAWEEDGDVDVFAYLIPGTPSNNVVTWTNDENQVVTTTNTVWTMAGPNLSGFGNDWEWRGTASVSNGVGVFTDAGAVANPIIMGFYAAAEANDTDGDGWNDGWERFVWHTDPAMPNILPPDPSTPNPTTNNVFWIVTTTNEYRQRYGMGNCPSNAPAQQVDTKNVIGARPTTNSMVSDVKISGPVDDAIKVDGNAVDWIRGPQSFTNRCITNEISDLQSGEFALQLWDWPAADYAGPNEARFGDRYGNPFRVEWTWKVPVWVTIEGAWSEQIPGSKCNSLLAQNPMYMATRSNDMGYVSVAASVQPADAVGMAMVGVMHGMDVLSSACIQEPKTLLEFAPVGGRELYSVVGGFDMDGDGILQATEVSVVCPNRLVLLRQLDYVKSRRNLRFGAGITWGVASRLLDAFLDGTIPSDALSSVTTLDSEHLTHPLGASWNGNCTASASLYLYPDGTDVADDVAEDANLAATVTNSLADHSNDVAAWFAANMDETHVFGPWNWSSNGLEFAGAGLRYAFGHVNATGTVSATVRRSDLKATRIVYDGNFVDIYDFSYTGPFPSVYGATVQAGFPTLGTAGRVFKVGVEFSRDATTIDFRFTPD
ncbi:MAG: hypothetical protein IJS32_08185 [Kiritimatiellae bacterium]|nr:hypothetical protein [Kiritimatiellia bacterium]